jgi:hypothetical protein
MIQNESEERLGLSGYGPERAMYEAVLGESGIHRIRKAKLGFGQPRRGSGFEMAWRALNSALDKTAAKTTSLEAIYASVARPPIGLKDGPIPILGLAALLARADELGLYEEGSFVPVLTSDVTERLLRNPDRFAVRNFALRGHRSDILAALASALNARESADARRRTATVIAVVAPILRQLRDAPPYTLRTRSLSAEAIATRSVLVNAREPDELLFTALPGVFGLQAISATRPTLSEAIDEYTHRLVASLAELQDAYPKLLDVLEASVAQHLRSPERSLRDDIRVRAERLVDQIIDPTLRAFANALAHGDSSREAWLEQVGMVVGRTAPLAWSDDDKALALQTVAQNGLAFRRVESLHFSQASLGGQGFDAVRLGLTLSDGTDVSQVLTKDTSAATELSVVLAEVLETCSARLGSRGAEMLLSELAQHVLLESDDRATKADDSLDELRKGAAGA